MDRVRNTREKKVEKGIRRGRRKVFHDRNANSSTKRSTSRVGVSQRKCMSVVVVVVACSNITAGVETAVQIP